MNDTTIEQFFVRALISDEQVIGALEDLVGQPVDSLDRRRPQSRAYIQTDWHAEGFSRSFLLSILAPHPVWNFPAIYAQLAARILSDVLREEDDDTWTLYCPGSAPQPVEVVLLDDGIDVV